MADCWHLSRSLAFEVDTWDFGPYSSTVAIVFEIRYCQGEEEHMDLIHLLNKAINAMDLGNPQDVPVMENFTAIVKARSDHPLKKFAKELVGVNEKDQLDKASKKIGAKLHRGGQDFYGPGLAREHPKGPMLWILISPHSQNIQVRVEMNVQTKEDGEKLKPFMDELEKGGMSLKGLKAAFAA